MYWQSKENINLSVKKYNRILVFIDFDDDKRVTTTWLYVPY